MYLFIIIFDSIRVNNSKITKYNHSKSMHKHLSSKQLQKIHKFLLKDYTFLQDYIIVDSNPFHEPKSIADFNKSSRVPNNLHAGHKKSGLNDSQQVKCQSFVAYIMGTQQYVKFNKMPYSAKFMTRFQALCQLYEQGVILADNLFILDQNGQLYFYIIQAYTNQIVHQQNHNTSSGGIQLPEVHANRYITLRDYINNADYNQTSLNKKSHILDKLKILLDCVHQTGQFYINFNSEKIIIDLQDEEAVYLAPFMLYDDSAQFGNQSRMSMAYFPPQIITQSIASSNNANEYESEKQPSPIIKLNRQALLKNDIWAFGCVLLEILYFSSPAFYAINNKSQLQLIQLFMNCHRNCSMEFNIQWCRKQLLSINQEEVSDQKKQLVLNLLINSLQLDPKKRVLSSQKIESKRFQFSKENKITNRKTSINAVKQSSQTIMRTKQKQRIDTSQSSPINAMRRQPQNINIETGKRNEKILKIENNQITNSSQQQQLKYFEEGQLVAQNQQSYQFTLTLLNLINVMFYNQLRINVYLDRKYSVFISSNGASSNHKINKTITIKADKKLIFQLLSKPFAIQLIQKRHKNQNEYNQIFELDQNQNQTNQQLSTRIWVNLQTLVLSVHGKPIWNKPLIGSFSQMRNEGKAIKIKANLTHRGKEDKIICKTDRNTIQKTRNAQKLLLDVDNQLRMQILNKIKERKEKQEKSTIKRKQKQKLNKQNKDKSQGKQSANVSKGEQLKNQTIFVSSSNYFEKINNNLQQICQKWKNNSKQNAQNTKKPLLDKNPNKCPNARNNITIQQSQVQQLQIPLSLDTSRRRANTDRQIDRKIKQMLGKLNKIAV